MITQTFNHLIDHTNLKADAKLEDLVVLAKEAEAYRFNSICVRPEFVEQLSPLYRCSAAIAFPKEKAKFPKDKIGEKESLETFSDKFFLKKTTEETLKEVEEALLDGALEIDPVINIKDLIDEVPIKHNPIYEQLTKIIDKCLNLERKIFEKQKIDSDSSLSIYIKPIFSCELLNSKQVKYSVEILAKVFEYYKAKPEYENSSLKINISYKNSTGFIEIEGSDEAQANPKLITEIKNLLDLYDLNSTIQIKAAGGIRSYEDALELIKIAKERLSHLGTSVGIKICDTL